MHAIDVVDSLRKSIPYKSADTAVVRAYLLSSQEFSNRYHYDSALIYLERSLNFSQKIGM